jgi:integrase
MPYKTVAKSPAPPKRRPRGGGTVYQRPDGLWVAERTVKGTRTRRTGNTEALARARLARAFGPAGAAQTGHIGGDPLLSDYLLAWIARKHGVLRDRTRIGYVRIINTHLIPALGRLRISELDRAGIEDMLETMRVAGRAANTRRNARNVLSRACRDAIAWRPPLLTTNPVSGIEIASGESRFFHRPTTADYHALLDAISAAGDPYRDLFLFLMYTGARLGEALALEWSDVRLDDRTAMIRRADTLVDRGDGRLVRGFGPPKSKSSQRVVPLPEDIVWLFKARWTRFGEDPRTLVLKPPRGLVFPSPRSPDRPISPRAALTRFHTVIARAGLTEPRRLHDLRHWYATWQLSRGVPVAHVSQVIGHRSPEITYRLYAHVLSDVAKETAEIAHFMIELPRQTPEQRAASDRTWAESERRVRAAVNDVEVSD